MRLTWVLVIAPLVGGCSGARPPLVQDTRPDSIQFLVRRHCVWAGMTEDLLSASMGDPTERLDSNGNTWTYEIGASNRLRVHFGTNRQVESIRVTLADTTELAIARQAISGEHTAHVLRVAAQRTVSDLELLSMLLGCPFAPTDTLYIRTAMGPAHTKFAIGEAGEQGWLYPIGNRGANILFFVNGSRVTRYRVTLRIPLSDNSTL